MITQPPPASITKVLKAPTLAITDLATLQQHLPLLCSDKIDGIRCIHHPHHGVVSQKFLPIPNHIVREELTHISTRFFDGELITMTDGQDDDFNTTQSKIMARLRNPGQWQWRVFDYFANPCYPYQSRQIQMRQAYDQLTPLLQQKIRIVPQQSAYTIEQIQSIEAHALARNQEGVMLRRADSPYKSGRSTFREAFLLKLKRFADDEAVVTDLQEQQHNCNVATYDETGHTKRSSHADNLQPAGKVGALICEWQGKVLRVDGFSDYLRRLWWENPSLIVGKTITFRYQPHGTQTLPRLPKFKCIRPDGF